MAVPVAVYTNLLKAVENLGADLAPEYNVVKFASSKDEALADLPAFFAAGSAKALIIAGFVPADDAAAVSAAITAAAPSVRIVSLSRDDLEAAGIKLPPPIEGVPTAPAPADAARPDPVIVARLFKEKLAGL